jgi:hypothetical protein
MPTISLHKVAGPVIGVAVGVIATGGLAAAQSQLPAESALITMTVPGHGTIAPASSGTRSAGREGDYRAERRVEGFARGPHGQVDGLMLDDGTKVGTPPHALRGDLSDVVGRTVEVSGRREQARVHHATIVINGDLVAQAPVGPHGPPPVPATCPRCRSRRPAPGVLSGGRNSLWVA